MNKECNDAYEALQVIFFEYWKTHTFEESKDFSNSLECLVNTIKKQEEDIEEKDALLKRLKRSIEPIYVPKEDYENILGKSKVLLNYKYYLMGYEIDNNEKTAWIEEWLKNDS